MGSRTTNSFMVMTGPAAGEHPKVVQEQLGHSGIQVRLDTYTHVVEGLQKRPRSAWRPFASSGEYRGSTAK